MTKRLTCKDLWSTNNDSEEAEDVDNEHIEGNVHNVVAGEDKVESFHISSESGKTEEEESAEDNKKNTNSDKVRDSVGKVKKRSSVSPLPLGQIKRRTLVQKDNVDKESDVDGSETTLSESDENTRGFGQNGYWGKSWKYQPKGGREGADRASQCV